MAKRGNAPYSLDTAACGSIALCRWKCLKPGYLIPPLVRMVHTVLIRNSECKSSNRMAERTLQVASINGSSTFVPPLQCKPSQNPLPQARTPPMQSERETRATLEATRLLWPSRYTCRDHPPVCEHTQSPLPNANTRTARIKYKVNGSCFPHSRLCIWWGRAMNSTARMIATYCKFN